MRERGVALSRGLGVSGRGVTDHVGIPVLVLDADVVQLDVEEPGVAGTLVSSTVRPAREWRRRPHWSTDLSCPVMARSFLSSTVSSWSWSVLRTEKMSCGGDERRHGSVNPGVIQKALVMSLTVLYAPWRRVHERLVESNAIKSRRRSAAAARRGNKGGARRGLSGRFVECSYARSKRKSGSGASERASQSEAHGPGEVIESRLLHSIPTHLS